MTKQELLVQLQKIQNGDLAPEQLADRLSLEPFEDIGFAKIDHHRQMRNGNCEVIYGAGKTPEQIVGIVQRMMAADCQNILITLLSREAAAAVEKQVPLYYNEMARIGIANRVDKPLRGHVVVVSGGTSDMPVCEEAALTAECLGSRVTRVYDVGVAGLHRLLAQLPVLQQARVVIAVAGMEGALASVVSGLVDCPVIAVPTSVGYGANLGGLSALLAMLNSCASGVSVVNIDNGFGAGYQANIINQIESCTE